MPSLRPNNPALGAATITAASLAGILGTLYYLDIPSMLSQRVASRQIPARCYSSPNSKAKKQEAPSLAALQIVTSQITLASTYPLAVAVEKNIPIYDCSQFDLHDEQYMGRLKDEWAHIVLHGPGVYILKNFFAGAEGKQILDEANTIFDDIIAKEQQSSNPQTDSNNSGDHFAPPSANTRVWNSLSKHGIASPHNFYAYFSNPLWPHVCTAHLGPGYRMTTQLNIVRPGGQAQTCHRDYHLGFQTVEETAKFPKQLHAASALLTLQGAVVHTDMPLESGPTRFLPFSQMFEEGYMAARREEFQEYFAGNHVSLAMAKGDAVFFSPAIFHAAGENRTKDVQRSANLVQVSAAFGKPMESVDALPLIKAGWELVSDEVRSNGDDGRLSEEVESWVQAVSEGYPFPSNLDRIPPGPGGMAPESEQGLLRKGLSERWDVAKVTSEIRALRERSAAGW